MKIAIICGTRPEAIKLIPVYQTLKNSQHEVYLISTGQHREMLDQIFNFFDVTPDIDLQLMSQNQSLASFTSKAIDKIDNAIEKLGLDLMLVQGDTTTAMSASLVGYYHQIQIGHVEAGLRTYEKYSPFPEEINRRIISVTGDHHFAPTKTAADNLKAEGVDQIVVTGNTVIDSLFSCRDKVMQNEKAYVEVYKNILDPTGKNILVTGHRRESFGEGFQNICGAIKELSQTYTDHQFVYPVHLNPNVKLVVDEMLNEVNNIKLIAPVSYDHMIFLMSRSRLILSDSGGIQEEAPSFDIPVVVMRNHTERQEGVDAGCAVLAGTKKKDIITHTRSILDHPDIYNKMANATNPYGDGTASRQILDYINKL